MQTTMAALGELGGTGGEDIKAAATRLREVADTLAVTAARLDRLVAENEGNVDRFADQGLAEFEQLLRETRQAVRSFDSLTESLEQDPSRVIYRPASRRRGDSAMRTCDPRGRSPRSRPAASAGSRTRCRRRSSTAWMRRRSPRAHALRDRPHGRRRAARRPASTAPASRAAGPAIGSTTSRAHAGPRTCPRSCSPR